MRLREDELTRWGHLVGRSADTPLVLALRGPLGAGKSVLARAVARGAGVEGPIPSPTFNLVFRYQAQGGRIVTHLDLYRLERADDLWELGWEELGGEDEIVLVEWPERAGDLLPEPRWDVELRVPRRERDLRDVSIARVGQPEHLPGFPIGLALSGG